MYGLAYWEFLCQSHSRYYDNLTRPSLKSALALSRPADLQYEKLPIKFISTIIYINAGFRYVTINIITYSGMELNQKLNDLQCLTALVSSVIGISNITVSGHNVTLLDVTCRKVHDGTKWRPVLILIYQH